MAAAITIRMVVSFFATANGRILTAVYKCIVPILIIVQIALGQGTRNVQTTVTMIQAGTHSQIVLDTIDSEA